MAGSQPTEPSILQCFTATKYIRSVADDIGALWACSNHIQYRCIGARTFVSFVGYSIATAEPTSPVHC